MQADSEQWKYIQRGPKPKPMCNCDALEGIHKPGATSAAGKQCPMLDVLRAVFLASRPMDPKTGRTLKTEK